MNICPSSRTISLFNDHWQFQCNEIAIESAWQAVTLPHDWSILGAFSKQYDGATGYLPGGIGWYRKTFVSPIESASSQRVYLQFDGIYNNATLYLNGHKIHFQANGYAPFYLDVTPHLKKENTLIIEVDRRRYVDSRWYTGSGIYRDVHLITTNAIHIPIWHHTIQAQLHKKGEVEVTLQLQLTGIEPAKVNCASVRMQFIDMTTGHASDTYTHPFKLTDNQQQITIKQPLLAARLWHPDTPQLYQVKFYIVINNQIVDHISDTFGVRRLVFCKRSGFSINGINTPIKGVCLHHDAGIVGSAVPDEIWRRRLSILKQCGVNAIRIAHNPASKRLLTLCDELGLLVQDEFFDEWDYPKDKRLNMADQHDDFISRGYSEHFQQDAEKDLKNTLRSHINHPCIFMWSIGNEIEWTYPRNVDATGFFNASWDGNYFWNQPPNSPQKIKKLLATLPKQQYDIGKTAQKLAAWVKELDTTRPITANCILPSASYLSGYADALDVIGFSYRRVLYDYAHQHYPQLPIIGNENLSQWHEWQAVVERPFVSGLFLWTGINYMGETHGQWPVRTTDSGLLDTAGFKKASFYLFQSLWSEKPMLHMTTVPAKERDIIFDSHTFAAQERDPDAWKQKLWTWPACNNHWNYQDQAPILIEASSNCEWVELFNNGISCGKRILAEQKDRTMRWVIPFSAGSIELIGYKEKRVASRQVISTAASLSSISIENESSPDEQYKQLIVQLHDEHGVPLRHQQEVLRFHLSGDITWIGADNGSIENTASQQNNYITTKEGRALAIVQVLPGKTGTIKVSVDGKCRHSYFLSTEKI